MLLAAFEVSRRLNHDELPLPTSPPSLPPSPPLPPSVPSPPSLPPSPPSPPLRPGSLFALSSSDLVAALGDSAVSRIVLVAGTYEFDESMCSDQGNSSLCINRAVTIEAEVAGSVVLDAKGARRVIYVSSGGQAVLIGLHITGGNISYGPVLPFCAGKDCAERWAGGVCAVFEPPLFQRSPRPPVLDPHTSVCWQGGVFVDCGGEATLTRTNIYANIAEQVRPSALKPAGYMLAAHYFRPFKLQSGGGLLVWKGAGGGTQTHLRTASVPTLVGE